MSYFMLHLCFFTCPLFVKDFIAMPLNEDVISSAPLKDLAYLCNETALSTPFDACSLPSVPTPQTDHLRYFQYQRHLSTREVFNLA